MPDQPDLRNIFTAKTAREKSERAHELTQLAFDGMKKTRARQRLSRDFLRGRISANLPPAIRDAAVRHGNASLPGRTDILEYHAPQIQIQVMRQVAEIASQGPKIKRHPVARVRESSSVSTRIERIAVGVMGQLWGYRASCDPVLIDSEAASWVIPSTAHWAMPVDQYDYCTAEEWAGLPDDIKALWEWRPTEADGTEPRGRYRRYARRYRRDVEGRPEWDDEYGDGRPFKEDTSTNARSGRSGRTRSGLLRRWTKRLSYGSGRRFRSRSRSCYRRSSRRSTRGGRVTG